MFELHSIMTTNAKWSFKPFGVPDKKSSTKFPCYKYKGYNVVKVRHKLKNPIQIGQYKIRRFGMIVNNTA